MKHVVVSFYNDVLPPDIAELQRKIFNHFDIAFEQYKFPVGVQHDTAIDNYLTNIIDKTWDFVSIFDVDCIPLNHNVIINALKKIENGNTLYGNVQCTHSLEENTIKSPPYVGPMFCNFSRKVYEEAKHKSFGYNLYPNPDGHILEADVGEVFTRENEKRGVNVIYSYPTKVNKSGWNKPTIWNYDGGFGYPKFGWGWGTEYDSDTYHNFQIRISEKLFDNISPQELFREYCNSILYGK
jgi:hypothetical protein